MLSYEVTAAVASHNERRDDLQMHPSRRRSRISSRWDQVCEAVPLAQFGLSGGSGAEHQAKDGFARTTTLRLPLKAIKTSVHLQSSDQSLARSSVLARRQLFLQRRLSPNSTHLLKGAENHLQRS